MLVHVGAKLTKPGPSRFRADGGRSWPVSGQIWTQSGQHVLCKTTLPTAVLGVVGSPAMMLNTSEQHSLLSGFGFQMALPCKPGTHGHLNGTPHRFQCRSVCDALRDLLPSAGFASGPHASRDHTRNDTVLRKSCEQWEKYRVFALISSTPRRRPRIPRSLARR